MRTSWLKYYNALSDLNKLRIERNINQNNASNKIDLHGFGDASEKACGASIYGTYITVNGETKAYLLCSKSRVAPLKTITLPKLELCAAFVLAQLANKVQRALQQRVNNIYLWSDSTIFLRWIKMQPYELQTFYANRVADIHRLVSNATWRHVPSSQNPADVLSRGASVDELMKHPLWWNGSNCLGDSDQWPRNDIQTIYEDHGKEEGSDQLYKYKRR